MGHKRINCYKCIHFHVTWHRQYPRGCAHFGFKSKQLPSMVVYKSSGKPCAAFTPRPKSERDNK